MARSSSGGVALLIMWITSCFHVIIKGPYGSTSVFLGGEMITQQPKLLRQFQPNLLANTDQEILIMVARRGQCLLYMIALLIVCRSVAGVRPAVVADWLIQSILAEVLYPLRCTCCRWERSPLITSHKSAVVDTRLHPWCTAYRG